MMHSFAYEQLAQRVVFGHGRLDDLGNEVERLSMKRPLVLTTPGQAHLGDDIVARIGGGALSFSGAVMHTPIDVTDAALRMVVAHAADGLIAIGGGSAIGLGKAIALRTDLPQIAIPTTYAGSEVTPIIGETRDGLKTTQRTLRVLPETVLYDPALTRDLPVATTVCSAFNAIAHAAEALYAQDRNPVVSLMAQEGVRALVASLPRIMAAPRDPGARRDALYGAWLCGTCLGAVGMSLHHKLCHTLGGAFGLPHAETHCVLLPHALAYNLAAAPEAEEALRHATGFADPAAGLQAFAASLGAPMALRDLGMTRDAIDIAADLALRNPYANPRPIERSAIRGMLERAWNGAPVVR